MSMIRRKYNVLEVMDGDPLEDIDLDSQEGRLRVWKLDETGFGSCPKTGFVVSCLGFSGLATRRLVVFRKARKSVE